MILLEASRRIELLYTDLQSIPFPNEINDIAAGKYQDKAGTAGEPDTHDFSDLTKENAANLAGFNGAKDVVEGVYSYSDRNMVPRIIAIHFGVVAA